MDVSPSDRKKLAKLFQAVRGLRVKAYLLEGQMDDILGKYGLDCDFLHDAMWNYDDVSFEDALHSKICYARKAA